MRLLLALALLVSAVSAQTVVASYATAEGKDAYFINAMPNREVVVFLFATSSWSGAMLGFWRDVPSVVTHDPRGIVSAKMPQGGITWIAITWLRPMRILKTIALPVPAAKFLPKKGKQ